jgi:hypothetical protein
LEKLVGQFDSVRQSRLFNDLALEQGTNSILYVAHSRHARQAIKTDVFIPKGAGPFDPAAISPEWCVDAPCLNYVGALRVMHGSTR